MDKAGFLGLRVRALPPVLDAQTLVHLAPKGLTKVFYSDNGSTAVEIAAKMAIQYWRQ